MGQFGLAKDANTPGTTPEVLQQLNAALFYANVADNPVATGGKITLRSDLSFQYDAGVGVIATPAGAVFTTWGAGTLSVAAPTATTTYTIYADKIGLVHVVTTAAPAGVTILGKYTLNAGATSTAAATNVFDVIYAVGKNDRLLFPWVDAPVKGAAVPTGSVTLVSYRTGLPTDSNIMFEVFQAIRTWPQDGLKGSMMYEIYVDGTLKSSFEMRYDRLEVVAERHKTLTVPAGNHLFEIKRKQQYGDPPYYFGLATDTSNINIVLRGSSR